MCKWQLATHCRYALILTTLSLSACGTNGLLQPQIVSATVIYPNLPDLQAPQPIPPKDVQFSFPKDSSQFVAMDYSNWVNLAYNIELFKQRESEWQAVLAQVNKERADWRAKNQANNETPPPPPTTPVTKPK